MRPDLDERRPRLLEREQFPRVRLPRYADHPRRAAAAEERIGHGAAGQCDEQRARDQRRGGGKPFAAAQPDKANSAHERQRRAGEERHRGVPQRKDTRARGQERRLSTRRAPHVARQRAAEQCRLPVVVGAT